MHWPAGLSGLQVSSQPTADMLSVADQLEPRLATVLSRVLCAFSKKRNTNEKMSLDSNRVYRRQASLQKQTAVFLFRNAHVRATQQRVTELAEELHLRRKHDIAGNDGYQRYRSDQKQI